MLAMREIVSRDIFTGFEVPKEFGDEFEMILVPINHLSNSSSEEKSFEDMTDEQRWEKYGNWDPSAKNMNMCCASMMNKLDEEYGSEDYEAWQK